MMQLFEACQVLHGNQRVRGARIVCGKCARDHAINNNMFKAGGQDDDDLVERRVTGKFVQLGWKVGKTPGQHRCPQCVTDANNARLRYLHATKNERNKQTTGSDPKPKQESAMTAKVVDIKPPDDKPHAEPPREMSRDDRRIVFTKLQEAYDNEQTGYLAGWTDERVATDLGVPLAWVKELRSDFFGPVGSNPQIDALLVEAKGLHGEITKVFALIDNCLIEARALGNRVEVIDRRIAEIAKAVGR